jgi:signal transduction histidine kinase
MSEAVSLDALPDAVLHLDGDQQVVGANRAALRLTGFAARDLTARRWGDVLDARDHDGRPVGRDGWHRSTVLRSVRAIPEQIVTITRADGRAATVSVTGAYERTADGVLTGAVLCLRDRASRRAGAVSGIEIVSTVSHELRSPLTSVKGYTSLLLNRWDRLKDDQKRMMLEQVNHDADRVTRLITELLDISRLETGRLVLRRQLVDLAALATSVVGKVRLEYPDLDVHEAFDPDFPRVYADPDKLEQVLTNLVENACKYATPQGLRITGSLLPAGPGGQAPSDAPDAVSVTVTDQGEGIPASDLGQVFTKFFRRAEGRPTGSGLGLWISRGLVESHGGRLTASSVLGEGTSFSFTLPLVDPDQWGEP